jgi:hypothetical protein
MLKFKFVSDLKPHALWAKEKPVLKYNNSEAGDTLELQKGDTLNITCCSSLPSEWVIDQGDDIEVCMLISISFSLTVQIIFLAQSLLSVR